MPDRAPGDWRTATAGKRGARPDAAMESIGEHLRSKFDKILTEPLPKTIMDLMAELDWGRAGASAKSRRP